MFHDAPQRGSGCGAATWVGSRSTLLELVRLRFGEMPEPIVARVRAADAGQVEGWAERVLASPTLDDALTER